MSGKTFAKVFSRRPRAAAIIEEREQLGAKRRGGPRPKNLPPEPPARLDARIPQAVHDHLMLEALRQRKPMRTILLEALAAIGIDGSERGR